MNRRLTLEDRIARLERKLHPVNEAGELLTKIIPSIIKNLPLAIKMIEPLIEAFKSDQINDNTDKIETLEKFTKAAKEVVELFNSMKK